MDSKPNFLYKYQSYSIYSLENLQENKLYFNDPRNFNDPFDCVHPLESSEVELEAALNLLSRDPDNPLTTDLSKQFKERNISNENLLRIYKFAVTSIPNPIGQKIRDEGDGAIDKFIRSVSEQIKNPEQKENLFEQIVLLLTKGTALTLNAAIRHTRKIELPNTRISCFCENLLNIQMWSYYADGHKGFCLEFDTSFIPFTKMVKVRYVDRPPSLNLKDFDSSKGRKPNVIESFMGVKHKTWEHEKEWRILLSGGPEFIPYSNEALVGIHFGSQMKTSAMEIIRSIAESQNPHVKFYKMKKDPIEFKMKSVPHNK